MSNLSSVQIDHLLKSGLLQFSLYENDLSGGEKLISSRSFNLDGYCYSLPAVGVLRISPLDFTARAVKKMVVSCGIHGNETAPIEILDALIGRIFNGELKPGCELLCVYGNLDAISLGQRFIDENMNRLFAAAQVRPNFISNRTEWRRARELCAVVDEFYRDGDVEGQIRLHLDLHTAIRSSKHRSFAILPFVEDAELNLMKQPDFMGFLDACGIDAVLLSHKPATTFSYHTSHHYGAMAFTFELGKAKPFGENDLASFNHFSAFLAKLIAEEGLCCSDDSVVNRITRYQVKHEIIKSSDDFELLLDAGVANFTSFGVGTQITRDLNALDGMDMSYRTSTEEQVVFPNADVAVGQRAGLMLEKLD